MSSREDSRRRRVTYQQLESLWEFLNSHKDIAVGFNKSAQAREYAKRMWILVAESLNSQGEGATKDWKGWSNYWVDYKAKLKRRVAAIRTSQTRTGGGPSEVSPLNDLEKKFLSLLGEGFGLGLPDTQVDPFPNLPQGSGDVEPEPVAGPSNVEFNILEQEIVVGELQQEVPVPLVPAPEEIPVPPVSAPEEEQTSRTEGVRRRRRSRQPSVTQEAARKTLVELAKARLQLEQQNASVLAQIGVSHQQSLEVWREMLSTLKSIATLMEK